MKLALLQFHSVADKEQNLAKVASLIKLAAKSGAELVVLPETFNFRGKSEHEVESSEFIHCQPLAKIPVDYTQALGPSLRLIHDLAKHHSLAIMAGSILETISDYSYCAPKCKAKALSGEMSKAMNTATYFSSTGELLAKYSKVHLFDTEFCFEAKTRCPGAIDGENIRIWRDESLALRFAIAICYDLRFPELFRRYTCGGQGSAELVFVPSAFSVKTGPEHWRPLLQARAIENSCYIVAPNQVGLSESGFECHGDSLVVDPWGRILDLEWQSDELALVDIDLEQVKETRKKMPLSNIRI